MNNTSYKDPSGFVFKSGETFYRQVNLIAKKDFDMLMNCGLYEELVQKGCLIPHEEITLDIETDENFYKFLKPQQIEYISYPYEWAFSALKDAALLTLKIQKTALKYGMTLKDASSFNIQFLDGKPVFIDTLSFEEYKKDTPWKAYGQFCRHFTAPLALMSYTDISLNKLFLANIDGIPLDIASKLLPTKAKLNLGIMTHICLHSVSQKTYEDKNQSSAKSAKMSLFEQEAIIDFLMSTIKALKFPKIYTEWGNYYKNTNYSDEAFKEKYNIIEGFINEALPKSLCDLGANRGDFSRIASEKNIKTLAFDIDPAAVEDNYLQMKKNKEIYILPLLQDFTNPSPSIGFMNNERADFSSRFKCDTVMALALIHHLSISNNLPFKNTAQFFSRLAPYLIIEFVPKEDTKVQILLSSREDIFDRYDKENFEKDYSEFYEILQIKPLKDSKRILYFMRRKNND